MKIRSQYGYKLNVPIVNRLITSALIQLNPENAHFYATGRVPISAVATVRMQNEVRRAGIELAAARSQSSSGVVSDDTTADGESPDNIIGTSPVECDENGLADLLAPDPADIGDPSADICAISPTFLGGVSPTDPQSSPVPTCG